MARPTRIDLQMMSGSNQEFEWVIASNDSPLDISLDLIEIFFSRIAGTPYNAILTSLPGAHYDGAHGVIRKTFTSTLVPPRSSLQIGWYEIWRTPSNIGTVKKIHIVGEMAQLPTNRL
jgi:hypothetical protein